MALPGPLVDSAWLVAALAEGRPQVRVVDVRWYLDGRSGHDAYLAGHIPGAVWLDVDGDLSAPAGEGTGRHPLPTPGAFAATLARVGIGPSTPVVAYDDAGGSIAARLWWMLDALGRPVAILDGGLQTWPGPLEIVPAETGAQTTVTARETASGAGKTASGAGETDTPADGDGGGEVGDEWPAGATIDTTTLDGILTDGRVVVLDARSADRYRGVPHPADVRAGHIPGARSAPWADNLDPVTSRFASAADLRARFESLGLDRETSVVASCGSGVTACHDLLALRLAGYEGDLRLYPGSWSAWASDPDRPVEVGPDRS